VPAKQVPDEQGYEEWNYGYGEEGGEGTAVYRLNTVGQHAV
jgi:hypothetical protein